MISVDSPDKVGRNYRLQSERTARDLRAGGERGVLRDLPLIGVPRALLQVLAAATELSELYPLRQLLSAGLMRLTADRRARRATR